MQTSDGTRAVRPVESGFGDHARLRVVLLATVLLATACRPPAEPVSPGPAGEVEAGPAPRPFLQSLPVDSQFAAAVTRGTRTRTGEPGPSYWTNRVDYRIEVRLDPSTAQIEGEEWVTYHNDSPDTIRTVVVRLYQNLFRAGTPKNRNVPATDGMELRRVVVGGEPVPEAVGGESAPGASYQVDGTVMRVRLAEPIPPASSETLEFAWRFEVPPAGAPRHGHIDHRVYNVAQWYPQIATYDDLEGWHTWPYLGDGEFYLEYGDFEVAITLPEGWLVAATGELLNADEVLTDSVRDRLDQARHTEEPVHVVTREDFGAGRATSRVPGGELTWQFAAEDVRDFAFAASSEYLWDATRAVTPDSERDDDTAPDTIAVHTFYTPAATHWRESATFVRHALSFHAEHWHPYVWPQMTGASGPVGGMEYPMLTFVAAFNSPRLVYTVLNHEIGHMWYPMMVGSNEPSYAWMDEGFATYIENYASADFFGDTGDWEATAQSALEALASPNHTPVMLHADLHGPTGTRGASSYHKPAMLLRALEGIIGRDQVWQSLREYSDTWIFRHPAPFDFFNLVERVAGRDLDWFWYPWFYETVGMDQAIKSVQLSADGRHATVTVEDQGEAPMPIRLGFTLQGGAAVQQVVPVDVWLDGARTWSGSFDLAAPVTAVEIDPEELFLDVDRGDNRWTR